MYPILELVQPRKICPCLAEILVMGRKESNKQTNKTNRRHAEQKTESKQAVYIKINTDKQTRAIKDKFNDNGKDKGKMQISETDERGHTGARRAGEDDRRAIEPQNAPYTICSLEVHIVYPAYTICSPLNREHIV